MERGEDGVWATGGGAQCLQIVDCEQPRHQAKLDTDLSQDTCDLTVAVPGERPSIAGGEDLARAGGTSQLEQRPCGQIAADHQTAGTSAQRLVEVGQALEQEAGARRRAVPAVQQPVIEAEHRHDPIVPLERGAQRHVIVQPQVAPEPDERRDFRTVEDRVVLRRTRGPGDAGDRASVGTLMFSRGHREPRNAESRGGCDMLPRVPGPISERKVVQRPLE